MRDDLIGWDIGGAHIKAARVDRNGVVKAAAQIPCALWRGLAQLTDALDAIIARIGSANSHAITMTGEMVDLFPDRHTGVVAIANVLHEFFAGGRLDFYCGGDSFVAYETVTEHAASIASANWRAPVQLLTEKIRDGIFIDIGSTTTDLIAIANGGAKIIGHDDFSRLASGELVYTGVVRTPLMALSQQIEFRGAAMPLIAELFATTADVYRLTDELPADADQHPSADGADKSMLASARRIARMIGCDMQAAPMEEWRKLAFAFRTLQQKKIEIALRKVEKSAGLVGGTIIVAAGVGQFLARDFAHRTGRAFRSFADFIDCSGVDRDAVANFAPAVAVALLGLRRCAV